ncbi:crotonase/enoyl-CoA hydratase family protein [Parasphingorhabdus sp.]|uniref:crotonase/enoyl-CoA hydratase family protein n=1 Tax=Parasphingorhabdus sp. TaxID=2709688 RepID=UPI003A9112A1
MSERVTISVEDHIADVRFNRPDKMNALDAEQIDAIVEAGEKLAAMEGIRAIVLSGEGRAFCAGLDMGTFAASAAAATEASEGGDKSPLATTLTDRSFGNANKYQHIVLLWRKLKAPVIAAIHGPCIGGGLQFASAADIRVVAPDAKMSIMEMRWGLIPDMGSFTTWRNFVRDDILRELTYTNRIFTGEEGKELGFVTHLSDNPHAKAMEIAREIASKHPQAVQVAKDLINKLPDMNEDEILMMESVGQEKVSRTPNQVEAVMAFMQKRTANFTD